MKVAKAEPGTTIRMSYGGQSLTFQFGEDGTRQVTETEAQALERYSGPAKVEVTEPKKKGGK